MNYICFIVICTVCDFLSGMHFYFNPCSLLYFRKTKWQNVTVHLICVHALLYVPHPFTYANRSVTCSAQCVVNMLMDGSQTLHQEKASNKTEAWSNDQIFFFLFLYYFIRLCILILCVRKVFLPHISYLYIYLSLIFRWTNHRSRGKPKLWTMNYFCNISVRFTAKPSPLPSKQDQK